MIKLEGTPRPLGEGLVTFGLGGGVQLGPQNLIYL